MYIGIDASLNATGIAAVDGEQLLWTYTIGSDLKSVHRLKYLRDAVSDVLTQRGAPAAINIEGYSYGSKQGAHQIGEWGGVLRLMLMERGHRVYTMPPPTLKKFATGKGNTPGKAPMALALYKLTGIDLSHADDEVDAAWLAYALQEKEAPCLNVSKDRASCLEKIDVLFTNRTRQRRK